jgi:hypothetical protein
VTDSCEYGNETSGSIKDREFLDKLSDCKLLKEFVRSFVRSLDEVIMQVMVVGREVLQ